MALTITHTVPLGDRDDVESGRLTHERIWTVMQQKAADPLDFVPMITDSKVIERYADGFLREVVFFGRDRVLERVRPRPDKHRILFEVVNDPRLELIFNELDLGLDGGFTYTLTTRFSDVFFAAAKADFAVLERFEKTVLETARASAQKLGEKARALAGAA